MGISVDVRLDKGTGSRKGIDTLEFKGRHMH